MKFCIVKNVFKYPFRVTFVRAMNLEIFPSPCYSTSLTLGEDGRANNHFNSCSTLATFSPETKYISRSCNCGFRKCVGAATNKSFLERPKFDADNNFIKETQIRNDSNIYNCHYLKAYKSKTPYNHLLQSISQTSDKYFYLFDYTSAFRKQSLNKPCINLVNICSLHTNKSTLMSRNICERQLGTYLISKRGYSWYRPKGLFMSASSDSLGQEQSKILELDTRVFSIQRRFKRKKALSDNRSNENSESESDSEEEDEEEDYDAPLNFKEVVVHLKSLRADSIVSSALDLSRNRVDEIFFSSLLRCNKHKLLKKSRQGIHLLINQDFTCIPQTLTNGILVYHQQSPHLLPLFSRKLKVGDFVDVITEKLEDKTHVKVKRVKVAKISTERTSKDKLIVSLRVWKSPFIVSIE